MTQALTQTLLTTDAGVGRWQLSPTASTVTIAHKTMWGLATVKGRFTGLTGTGTIEEGGAVSGSLIIDAASLDTKHKKRDQHLRSADFFDAENYPEITVAITSARLVAAGLELHADIEVKGIHKQVVLAGRLAEVGPDTVRVVVDAQLDRGSFGLSWNKLGMMTGLTTVAVTAIFTRSGR